MFRNLSTDALRITGRPSELNELALTYGYSGIDLPLNELQGPGAKQNLEHAQRLLASTDLKIGCLPLSFSLECPEAEFAEHLVRLAKIGPQLQEIGCTRMAIMVRPASDEHEFDVNYQLHVARLKQLAETAGKFGILIGIDFLAAASHRKGKAHEFLHDFASIKKLADEAGVGYVVDAWSIYASGGSLDVVSELDAKRIVRVFVSDAPQGVAPADLSDRDRLAPEKTGVLDTAAMLAKLHAVGYEGPVTVKAPKSSFGSPQRDSIVREAGERLLRQWATFDPSAASKFGGRSSADKANSSEEPDAGEEGDEDGGEPVGAQGGDGAASANGSV